MNQHDRHRGSEQAPAKDFLALTHGQEWVNFYESFDKLVQDHLTRSSELLRRAMSLPEVADREVAQVRAEMEGELAAERERSHGLLTKLRDEITARHDQVATIAQDIQGVAADLAALNARVSDALASLDLPSAVSTAKSPAMALDVSIEPTPAGNGVAEAVEPAPHERAASRTADDSVGDDAPAEAVAPVIEEWGSAPAADVAEPEARFDAESGLDLSALAEAETALDVEPFGAGAESPRPHWLAVTRVGSCP